MTSNSRIAFFGLAGDPYSLIAQTHVENHFASVQTFLTSNQVPPLAPNPGILDVDWLFCFKSKTIFRSDTLDSVRKRAINFHTSSPAYPGSGGVNWALYNQDETAAITVHEMTTSVDAGPILEVSPFPCAGATTVAALLDRTYQHHLLAFLRVTQAIAIEGMAWVEQARRTNSDVRWGAKTFRIRDLDELKKIETHMSSDEMNRRISATRYRQYGPFIELHGRRFTLGDS